MIELHGRLRVHFDHGQQIAPPPKIMALPLDILARSLACLRLQFRLLAANPLQPGHRIGARNLQPSARRRDQRDVPRRRMHRQVDVLDRLARYGDDHIAELNRLGH